MTATLFSGLFVSVLVLITLAKLWLARRQLAFVAAHRAAVPAAFSAQIDLASHQRAADYTRAKMHLSMTEAVFDALLLLAYTLGGGIAWLSGFWLHVLHTPIHHGVVLLGSVLLLSTLLELPFGLYQTFVIEARFDFNKTTPKLYLADTLKSLGVGALFGVPLLYGVLWLMARMGAAWWLYVWGVWVGFVLLLQFIYPFFIAPLFNKFTPLQDEALKARIEALLHKCGFSASGLFVMDGSRRSAHGNAYFTGFGKTKRIVFFDTLLERLSGDEIEAVLAHELGHFRRHHVLKRMAATFAISLAFLWGLALLMRAHWFYPGLGVPLPDAAHSTALGLLLFIMLLPLFNFVMHPLASYVSRRHEFEADRYAVQQTGPSDLSHALVKMYHDNAATLTPDPLYSAFYDSHPPAPVRISHLQSPQGA